MILPIVAYGDPVLKEEAEEIDKDYPGLKELIDNMFETMYNADGVGLAAPQIGLPIRLFVVDASPMEEKLKGFKKVFINPIMVRENGTPWVFEEGCLSIPAIRENVRRENTITLNYLDENFVEHEDTFDGLAARVIQHEYDHIEGILFTDRISNLKKKLLRKKLENISKGLVKASYPMKFPVKNKR